MKRESQRHHIDVQTKCLKNLWFENINHSRLQFLLPRRVSMSTMSREAGACFENQTQNQKLKNSQTLHFWMSPHPTRGELHIQLSKVTIHHSIQKIKERAAAGQNLQSNRMCGWVNVHGKSDALRLGLFDSDACMFERHVVDFGCKVAVENTHWRTVLWRTAKRSTHRNINDTANSVSTLRFLFQLHTQNLSFMSERQFEKRRQNLAVTAQRWVWLVHFMLRRTGRFIFCVPRMQTDTSKSSHRRKKSNYSCRKYVAYVSCARSLRCDVGNVKRLSPELTTQLNRCVVWWELMIVTCTTTDLFDIGFDIRGLLTKNYQN